MFIGEVTVGTAFFQRLPEPPHSKGYPSVGGYPWSVQPNVITAAKWARTHLGINQPFGATQFDAYALATYGEQNTLPEDKVWPIFFATAINGTVVDDIKAEGVRYILVDWRMTQGISPEGYYFSPAEPDAQDYKQPFPAAALEKLVSASGTQLVYSCGTVQILDVTHMGAGSSAAPLASSGSNEGVPR